MRKINLSELSERMGVSRYLLLDWIKKGLPCKKTHLGYRFDYSQVIEWYESNVERTIKTEGKNACQN